MVDDASTDESIEFLKKNFPKIKLIEKITTSGFATSVNLGFKAAYGDLVVLLNTDVVPQRDFLKFVLPHFEDPRMFAVGCLDASIEGDKIVKRGRGIGSFKRGFLVHARGEIDKTDTLWVNGGSSVFRRSIWEKLGGFDALYNPFYWEDVDLSYRAQKSGYKIVFEPSAVVEHHHEEGSIKRNFTQNQIKRIAYRNQFIFVWKNITNASFLISHFFWLPYHVVTSILSGEFNLFVGFVDALVKLSDVLRRREFSVRFFKKTDKEVLQ